MKDREKIKQSILSLGKDGKVFTLDDVIGVTGNEIRDDDQSTLIKGRARTQMQSTFRSAGLKVRSIGKNTYKVVDEEDPQERQYQLKKRGKRMQSSWEEFCNYQSYMMSKGDPVQVEMLDTSLAAFVGMEVTQYNVPNARQNQAIPVTPASAKPKKAANH